MVKSSILLSVVTCGEPGKPTNGYRTLTGGTQYLDNVTFHCNPGYELSGSESAMCQSDGTWSEITTYCTGIVPHLYILSVRHALLSILMTVLLYLKFFHNLSYGMQHE